MPTLNWLGRDKVLHAANEVPVYELKHLYNFGGESENKIIHGDNLLVMKSLLPEYEGKVKCIYIDPPYNAGNSNLLYDDKVNSPQMQEWLGEVFDAEEDDPSKHDKWLCMVYPRLRLMRRLLTPDGLIFISIDEHEQAYLKVICDEIFGNKNFVANIAWEKRGTRNNMAKMFYSLKENILIYRKSDAVMDLKEPRTEKADSNYANPDNDPRGLWISSSYLNPYTKKERPHLAYDIESPYGRKVRHPVSAWKFSYADYLKHKSENRLWWGVSNNATYPRLKIFLRDQVGIVPVDLWRHEDAGTTDEASNTIKAIFGSIIFDTPKPVRLIERILKIATDEDSIVLDCFAGSGTTAHAVLKLNKEYGGNRKFILVEMENYVEMITAERVKRVIKGYGEVKGLGGSFDFYEIDNVSEKPKGKVKGRPRKDVLEKVARKT